MGANPYAKMFPGQPFEGLPTAAWNSMLDASAEYRRNRESRDTNGSPIAYGIPPIAVKNGSGLHLPRLAVVVPDFATFQPGDDEEAEDYEAKLDAFKNRRCLTVFPPGPTDDLTNFLILQEPIRANRTGPAMLLGVTPVRLDVVAQADRFAVAINGDYTKLQTKPYGSARIIWKKPGTGNQWGYVSLLPSQQESFLAILTDREGPDYSWNQADGPATGEFNAREERWACSEVPKGTPVRMRPIGNNQFTFEFDFCGQLAKAPSGGVPGRTGITPGSATVDITQGNGTVIDQLTARNHSTSPVAANAPLMLKYIQGGLWIDWEQCS